jgi:hypothetical protein
MIERRRQRSIENGFTPSPLKFSLIGFVRREAYNSSSAGHPQRITGSLAPSRNPRFTKGCGQLSVLKLRRFRLVASLTARCRVLFGARPCRTGSALARTRPPRHPSLMTIEEIEDVIWALTAVAEKLETGDTKQSIQEAFMQTRAYAGEMLVPASERPLRQRKAEA